MDEGPFMVAIFPYVCEIFGGWYVTVSIKYN